MKRENDFVWEDVRVLREALPYITRFAGEIFVIKFGGETLVGHNFIQMLPDIALLRSVGIRIVLIHGANPQIEAVSRVYGQKSKKRKGIRITDEKTMAVVQQASSSVTQKILASFSALNKTKFYLKGFVGNVVKACSLGIINETDYQFTGKVESIETGTLLEVLDDNFIPILSPLGMDDLGTVFNINADSLAVEVAVALQARKLIFLTNVDGVMENGELIQELTPHQARELLSKKNVVTGGMIPKLEACIASCENGVRRAHLLNYKREGIILLEVLSQHGLGTMVNANPYKNIRKAILADVESLMNLTSPMMDSGMLIKRTWNEYEAGIHEFVVFEKDTLVSGCGALRVFRGRQTGEIYCLAVDEKVRDRGYATEIIEYLENQARERGVKTLFTLSRGTQEWFLQRGFTYTSAKKLPPDRPFDPTRKSKILKKVINPHL